MASTRTACLRRCSAARTRSPEDHPSGAARTEVPARRRRADGRSTPDWSRRRCAGPTAGRGTAAGSHRRDHRAAGPRVLVLVEPIARARRRIGALASPRRVAEAALGGRRGLPRGRRDMGAQRRSANDRLTVRVIARRHAGRQIGGNVDAAPIPRTPEADGADRRVGVRREHAVDDEDSVGIQRCRVGREDVAGGAAVAHELDLAAVEDHRRAAEDESPRRPRWRSP